MKNTTPSEHLQNAIQKSQKEAKYIQLVHKYILSRVPGLFTGTSIKSGGIELVVLTQVSPLRVMMRSCKCLPHLSQTPTFTYNRSNNIIVKRV